MGDENVAVIVGVGEVADRSGDIAAALDPAGLMAAALTIAEDDAGVPITAALDRLDVVNEISWPYPDPLAEVRHRIGRPNVAARYHPVGGQTPLLALHEAALAIQAGEATVVAVVGGEAEDSVRRATRSGHPLLWPPMDPDYRPIRGGDHQNAVARALELTSPVNVYPLYENATRAAWGQDAGAAEGETAAIWVRNAQVARGRPTAWIKRQVTAADILTPEQGNRLIAWPYRKLMVANPIVNQGAAVVMTSLAYARKAGIADDRLVYVHGGSAADEPRDILARRTYTTSLAMEAVLSDVTLLAPSVVDTVELYSCFPCVPKMARRLLGLPAAHTTSVAGGLTFFGAPLNNYMTHAAVAMVERIRSGTPFGMLYGQGEYVTKHHALLLGQARPSEPLRQDYRHAGLERALTEAAPTLNQRYRGPVQLETYTILYDRDEQVRHGIAIARTPANARVAAKSDAADGGTLDALCSSNPIGHRGFIQDGSDMVPHFVL